jgi:uncharacterized protein YaiL (DUF2058 family)
LASAASELIPIAAHTGMQDMSIQDEVRASKELLEQGRRQIQSRLDANGERLEAERTRRAQLAEDLALARKLHQAIEAIAGGQEPHVLDAMQTAESLQAEFEASDITVTHLRDAVAADSILLEDIDSLLAVE